MAAPKIVIPVDATAMNYDFSDRTSFKVPTPTSASGAATKGYTDGAISGAAYMPHISSAFTEATLPSAIVKGIHFQSTGASGWSVGGTYNFLITYQSSTGSENCTQEIRGRGDAASGSAVVWRRAAIWASGGAHTWGPWVVERLASIGDILPMPGQALNYGHLACNGAAVSRTTYAALFAKIGTFYGAGDGSTTFNLPNLNPTSYSRTADTTASFILDNAFAAMHSSQDASVPDRYTVYYDLRATDALANADCRFRAAGADLSASSYNFHRHYTVDNATTMTSAATTSGNRFYLGANLFKVAKGRIDVRDAGKPDWTYFEWTGWTYGISSASERVSGSGTYRATVAADGIAITITNAVGVRGTITAIPFGGTTTPMMIRAI